MTGLAISFMPVGPIITITRLVTEFECCELADAVTVKLGKGVRGQSCQVALMPCRPQEASLTVKNTTSRSGVA